MSVDHKTSDEGESQAAEGELGAATAAAVGQAEGEPAGAPAAAAAGGAAAAVGDAAAAVGEAAPAEPAGGAATEEERQGFLQQIANLQQENHELQQAMACVVCHQERRTLACRACSNLALCAACSDQLQHCPLCREPLDVMRILLP